MNQKKALWVLETLDGSLRDWIDRADGSTVSLDVSLLIQIRKHVRKALERDRATK